MIEQNSKEKNEIQSKMETIIAKSKESRKLIKADETEMIELSKAFFSEKQNWTQGLENILNLPAETAAAVLINVWKIQSEQDQLILINEFLKKDKSLNAVIKQLYFIYELFKVSPDIAMETLHTISITVTDFGRKIPNRKILTTCAKTVLVNEGVFQITPEEHPIKKVDFASTGLLLVSSLLYYWENSAKSAKAVNTVHNLISWLSLNGSKVEYERVIMDDIEEKANSIDAESQTILLNLGFITKITQSDKAAPIVKEQPLRVKEEQVSKTSLMVKEKQIPESSSVSVKVPVPETTAAVKEEPISRTPVKDEQVSKRTKGDQLLKQLKGYLGGLETTNHELQEAVKAAADEVNSEKSKRQQLEVTADELKKNLSDKSTEIKILLSQMDHLNAELERMRQEFSEKEREHKEKLQSLIDMTERESVFVKDEFKNKLSSKLRLEYQDFKDILSEEMTVDLGENLRAQLENIFRLLKQEGMNF